MCMKRPTFGIIIGIFNIVFYVIASIGCIIYLVILDGIERQSENVVDDEDDLETLLKDYDDLKKERELKNFVLSYGRAILGIIFLMCLIMIVASALLVVGIVKKRPRLMAPWIFFSIIGLLMSCIIAIGNPVKPFESFLSICAEALIINVIYILYKDIRTRSNEPPNQIVTFTRPDQVVTATKPDEVVTVTTPNQVVTVTTPDQVVTAV